MGDVRTTQGAAIVAFDIGVDIRLTQADVFVAYRWPSDEIRTTQGAAYLTVNSNNYIRNTQSAAYVLILRGAGDRKLRAWTFTQDDHVFYVLQLGTIQTLIYDKYSQRWARWKSPDFSHWRGNDGCDWEGFNVCCDSETGKVFKIDPEGRLDYGNTPITSTIIGGMTERFRKHVPVFMAELAVSQALPPAGVDAETVGITLRVGDTLGWVDHGEVPGEPLGDRTTVRWYGLGLIRSPGIIFELTDTGYARRIDGLDIEIGPAKQDG